MGRMSEARAKWVLEYLSVLRPEDSGCTEIMGSLSDFATGRINEFKETWYNGPLPKVVEPGSRKRSVGSGTKNISGSVASLKKDYVQLTDKYTDLERNIADLK